MHVRKRAYLSPLTLVLTRISVHFWLPSLLGRSFSPSSPVSMSPVLALETACTSVFSLCAMSCILVCFQWAHRHTAHNLVPMHVSTPASSPTQLNDLEQHPRRSNGEVLVPRSAALFPPGFRGYWGQQQRQLQQGHQGQQPLLQQASQPGSMLGDGRAGGMRWLSVGPSAVAAQDGQAAQGLTEGPAADALMRAHLQVVQAEVRGSMLCVMRRPPVAEACCV